MLPTLPLTVQNRSAEMANLSRSRTLPTDGHAVKFLWTILKQHDQKNVSDRRMERHSDGRRAGGN